jgi:hypothetical protein
MANTDTVEFAPTDLLMNKITSIKKMVATLELRLAGYEWVADGNKFIYTGNVLAGSIVIAKATGLLQPFSEDANLFTTKEFKMFAKQKWEINSTFNDTLLLEMGAIAPNYKIIMKMFKSTLQNIGDIILGSKRPLQGLFAGDQPQENRRDFE